MLYRCKIIYFIIRWNNNHSSGVLTSCSFYSGTADRQSVFFSRICSLSGFFKIMFGITECSLRLHTAYSTGFKYIFRSEQFFGIPMSAALIFTGKVQIYIRRFITVKSQKCFKRNIMSVPLHIRSAFRTVLLRQIKTGTDTSIRNKFTVLTFRTHIMRS